MTAVKSMVLHRQFSEEFPQAVVSDFRMLYGVARHGSRVPVARFWRFFQEMGPPIQRALASQSALFDPDMVEAVFDCTESAFDYSVLRTDLMTRMDALNMNLRLNTEVTTLSEDADGVTVGLSNGQNDWRPILRRRSPDTSHIVSIQGGKIHNIYNLFDLIRTSNTAWAAAYLRHLPPRVGA